MSRHQRAVRRAAKPDVAAPATSADSEERLRLLLESIKDYSIVMLDPQGLVTTWNKGAERITGYRFDEIIGRHFAQFYLLADLIRGKPERDLAVAVAVGRCEDEGWRIRKDGTKFCAEVVITPIYNDAEKLTGFSKVTRDVSVRHEAERKFKDLLEAAPDAMVVVNQDGEIVLLNLQAEKQFGYHRDELLGQKVKNIIPEGFAERLIADDLRSREDAVAQQIGTGLELTGRRKDGGEFPIEIMLSPLESAEGVLVTAAIRDISVRKAAEELLAQMEGRYRGLLEAAPDAMVVVNQHGEIVLLNLQAEKQFGYRRDELLGQKVKNIIPEGFAERLIADDLRSAEDALAQQIGTGLELTGRRKDGGEFPIEIMLSPLESAEGVLVTAAIRDITERKRHEAALRDKNNEVTAAIRDITERKRHEAELQEKNNQLQEAVDELDAFSYSVSHDLRAPLRAIDGYTLILLKQYETLLAGEPGKYLRRVRDNTVRMGQLVDDLLRFSRLGRQPLSRQLVSTAMIVEQVLRDARQQAAGRSVKVSVGELLPVWGDAALLKQVFTNLIDNAFKYTRLRKDARVEIGSSRVGDQQVFLVRDNGVGFDMQYADKLFDVFQRLHRAEDFAGTGVGLAIVQRIVQRHGGRVWAEAAVDRGATFYFTLEGSHAHA